MITLQENPTLEEKLFQISIGVLLGDASIQKNTSKKVEKWRLKFSQSFVFDKVKNTNTVHTSIIYTISLKNM